MSKSGENIADTSMKEPRTVENDQHYMQFFDFDAASNQTKCRLCTKEKKFIGCHIYNLKRHLIKSHPAQAGEYQVEVKKRKVESDSSAQQKSRILSRPEYISHCVRLAVITLVTFAYFDVQDFRDLTNIHASKAGITITSANIGFFIALSAKFVRDSISQEIKHRMVSVKLDIASKNNRSMLGVNIQFYCKARKRITIRSLGCLELMRSHTALYLKTTLLDLLGSFGIGIKNIYCFTTDNGANMICLGKLMRTHQNDQILTEFFQNMQNTHFSSDEEDEKSTENNITEFDDSPPEATSAIEGLEAHLFVVRCACHSLQLVVHDVLKTFSTNIEKIRSAVKNLKSSKYLFNFEVPNPPHA
jgi:hypothetical protein